ncbi:MAG: HEPN domain-containing protein [Ginsengibacter sp.]
MIYQSKIIKLRIEKAKRLLLEIEPLMKLQFYTTVINRLYYSCFHATFALLLTKSITPKTHKGLATMLNLQFVTTGEFETNKAAFFGDLLKERIRDDCNENF